MHAIVDNENRFYRMLMLSLLAHILLFSLGFIFKLKKHDLKIETPQGMNVLWSDVVMAPPQTDENKLPAPVVQSQAQTAAPEDNSLTRSKQQRKQKPKKNTADQKNKALQSALNALNLEEDIKPTPKLNNFSSDQNTQKKGLPSGPTGGGSLMGNPNAIRYKQRILDIITQNLFWQDQSQKLTAVVHFRIDTQGNVLDIQLYKSSGNAIFDQRAVNAIKKSNPLPLPPEEIAQRLSEEQFEANVKPQ